MPDLKKAELLNGMVYLAAAYRGRVIDPSIPPLENGDRLSRAEFERRWANMPDLKKAELLNGEVFMAPPVSAENHGVPHSRLMFWLGLYWAATPGVVVADNSTMRVEPEDDAQPDAMLFVLPNYGGSARMDQDGYVCGIPDLVVEVAASSVSYDFHTKRDLYARIGVRELVIWRVLDEEINWLALRGGSRYELASGHADGIYRSDVFPGLWLDSAAMLRGDLAGVMRVAQEGAQSPEHGAFASRLKAAAGR